jgi:hypothetical protein
MKGLARAGLNELVFVKRLDRGAMMPRVVGSRFPRNLIRRLENENFPLSTLEALRDVRHFLDRVETRAIWLAHEQGASLADIADALGMSRQGVHYRLQQMDRGKAGAQLILRLPDEEPAEEPTAH